MDESIFIGTPSSESSSDFSPLSDTSKIRKRVPDKPKKNRRVDSCAKVETKPAGIEQFRERIPVGFSRVSFPPTIYISTPRARSTEVVENPVKKSISRTISTLQSWGLEHFAPFTGREVPVENFAENSSATAQH
jgi:hypothetical protein